MASTPASSASDLLAAGWRQDQHRPDVWQPPIDWAPQPSSSLSQEAEQPQEGEQEGEPPKGMSPSSEASDPIIPSGADFTSNTDGTSGADAEVSEVSELIAMIEHSPMHHAASKRPPLRTRTDGSVAKKGLPGAPGKALPEWDSTPHRNRPIALRGLNSVSDEPWKRSEELNFGADAHIEWAHSHKNLVISGMVPVESIFDYENAARKKSESMGNRLLRQQKRKLAAERRARAEAIEAARRAEEERLAAELEARRAEVEAALVRIARAEDAEVEQRLREAAAAAAARRRAEEEERQRLEEVRRQEEEEEKLQAARAAEEQRAAKFTKEREEAAKKAAATKRTAGGSPAKKKSSGGAGSGNGGAKEAGVKEAPGKTSKSKERSKSPHGKTGAKAGGKRTAG